MTINKYTGKTEEEAMSKVRKELGNAAVIMNVKVIKPKGLGGLFKSNTYEVTAAVEDDDVRNNPFVPEEVASAISNSQEKASGENESSGFDAVADDAIMLKNAFSAVNEVLEKQEDKSMPKQEFEPLSDSAPRTRLIEPTYSKPVGMRPVVAPIEEPRVKVTQTVEAPAARANIQPESVSAQTSQPSIDNDNHVFVKMLYNVLLENEVQEKYINQVLEDMDKVLQTSHSLDNLLSNVYQKMVLKLGTPSKIMMGSRRPKVVFFIGPTGVGKTTTIAKIASKFKVEEGKKVGLITADTYRMAAANQLQTYANILGVPLNVIYSADELLDTVKKQTRENEDLDVILVDTIGFSHRNEEQKSDTNKLISALSDYYDSEVYLVLSATTKYKDLIDIADAYMEFTDFNLIFTKLDETNCLGNIFNLKLYTKANLSYLTVGQNVPDDIEIVNAQKLVKQLLGGK
ncbi:flagellar biosynthesis protein FlhF [Pseudobutyrivibrio sp. NOR37]|uniref:Flagellar biosynthesis protein FlhF n=1 Tax=Pseudobutyrivibrio xylanivorans TaxID=185007 RepID=A0A6M0LFV4_PSEXY|nr:MULTISPECIES: flagellar biosynthesis protein FlhF [Pseudobutyrivibrio]NEX01000.1 flagellar biosynthesis protein FlhF [Pseudobutyrivibrio xylanivorans]SFR64310.1 flagellar biosynthesis protein FlhF [Pseudobutyrivibrio sp. NOR37]